MRKLLTLGLALFLSGCVAYGYTPRPRPLPEYTCYSTPTMVVCYNNITGRVYYYERDHYLYGYWYNYSNLHRQYIYVQPQPRDRRGVATPKGYRKPPGEDGKRVAVPRSSPNPQVTPTRERTRVVPPKSTPTTTEPKVKPKLRPRGGGEEVRDNRRVP